MPETTERHCKIEKCKQPYRAKGYCRKHYKKWRHGEYGLARYKTCHKGDCRLPMVMNRQGLCEEHFQEKFSKKSAVAAPAEAEGQEKAAEKKEEKTEEGAA